MHLSLTQPGAVIFDMDGLLLDSERVLMEVQERVFAELGLEWRREECMKAVGLSAADSDELWMKVYGPDHPIDLVRTRCTELYEEAIHTGAIPTKPFVRELLDHLDALRIPRAVATSTVRFHAEAKLARTHLLPRMNALACGDEVMRCKPAPDIFELAAARLGVQARDCLVLEDSNTGVRAAVAASMQVVMVPDLVRPDPDIRRLGVPCAESLKDILVALNR
jgi:HAD superfamily hydrolase (TIGR01509 family)